MPIDHRRLLPCTDRISDGASCVAFFALDMRAIMESRDVKKPIAKYKIQYRNGYENRVKTLFIVIFLQIIKKITNLSSFVTLFVDSAG